MTDQRKVLEHVGEALYGPRWQTELARLVGVSDRTMRRWLAEPHDMPEGVWRDIVKALQARIKVLHGLSNAILDDILRSQLP